VTVTVTSETSGLDRLTRDLQQIKKLKLRVGYQDEGGKAIHPDSEVTVAKIAAVMEFGEGDDTPARSFIRSTISERAKEIGAEYERQLSLVVTGERPPVQAVAAVGKLVVDLIRRKIKTAGSWAAPLDKDTIRQKGGKTTPLDVSGTLADNLSYRVSIGRETLARGS